jgi:hypothetical protein
MSCGAINIVLASAARSLQTQSSHLAALARLNLYRKNQDNAGGPLLGKGKEGVEITGRQ